MTDIIDNEDDGGEWIEITEENHDEIHAQLCKQLGERYLEMEFEELVEKLKKK